MHGMKKDPCGFSAPRLLIGCGKTLYIVWRGASPLHYARHVPQIEFERDLQKPSSQRRWGSEKRSDVSDVLQPASRCILFFITLES